MARLIHLRTRTNSEAFVNPDHITIVRPIFDRGEPVPGVCRVWVVGDPDPLEVKSSAKDLADLVAGKASQSFV